MKKLLLSVTLFLVLLALAACAGGEAPGDTTAPATTAPVTTAVQEALVFTPAEATALSLMGVDGYVLTDYRGTGTSLTVPATYLGKPVVAVDGNALRNHRELESLTLPDSLLYIGEAALFGCSSLRELTLPFVGTKKGEDGRLGDIFGTYLYAGSTRVLKEAGGGRIVFYYLPSGLASLTLTATDTLPPYALAYCQMLTEVSLPRGLTEIGAHAFEGCCELRTLDLPSGLVTIGEEAFSNCDRLTSLDLPEGLLTVGASAFSGCSALRSVTLPTSLLEIGDGAFYCPNLFEVRNFSALDVTAGSLAHGGVAFSAETVLTDPEAPSVIHTTEDGFVYYARQFFAVLLDYEGESLTPVLPDTLAGLDYFIGQAAFIRRPFLSVTIGAGAREVGALSFIGCEALETVSFAEGSRCVAIATSAFSDCPSLSRIFLPASLVSIDRTAFYGCLAIAEFYVDPENEFFRMIDGNLYTNDATTLVKYAIGKTDEHFTVPSYVTTVGRHAFAHAESLRSVTLPASVTSIDLYAFYDCSSLELAVFEDPVGWHQEEEFSSDGGIAAEVTDPVAAARALRSVERVCSWYKE